MQRRTYFPNASFSSNKEHDEANVESQEKDTHNTDDKDDYDWHVIRALQSWWIIFPRRSHTWV